MDTCNQQGGGRGQRMRKFIRMRFSTDDHLGLQLTLGLLLTVAAAWVFAALAEDVETADRITVLDLQLANWLHAHATPALTHAMLAVSTLHGVVSISIMTVVLAAFLNYRRERGWLLALVLAVPGGMLLNTVLKDVFKRARPHFVDPIVTLSTYSFPSGHAAGSALFYGLLAAFLIAHTHSNARRAAIAILALLLVVLVAASRMYLGAHYFSDVVAAIFESVAWLALCVTGVNVYCGQRAARVGRAR